MGVTILTINKKPHKCRAARLTNVYLGSANISPCDMVNNFLHLASVNLISYLIFDGEIGDTECIDVT